VTAQLHIDVPLANLVLFSVLKIIDNSSLLLQVEVYNTSSGWSVLGFESIGKRSFASAVVL